MLLLLLRLSADLVGDLPLLLLLVDGDAALHVVLELSALARGQLVQLELENLPSVGRQALLNKVYDAALLLLGQGSDVQLQLIFLVYVHGLIRVGGGLGEHDVIFDLRLRPLVLAGVHSIIRVGLLSGLQGLLLWLDHALWRGLLFGRACGLGSSCSGCADLLDPIELLLYLLALLDLMSSRGLGLRDSGTCGDRRLSDELRGRWLDGLFENGLLRGSE